MITSSSYSTALIGGKKLVAKTKKKSKKHPGFKAVQNKIASEGYSKKQAGAILANASRNASKKAKKKNPKLKKVK